MSSLQTTQLDHVDVRSVPLLGEFIEGHGDSTVYYSAKLREVVPGGIAVNRIVIVTDAAVYKIPQTASETGLFFNSRVPLANFTQILVMENDAPCVQFNGMKATTGEQSLFTLDFDDDTKKRDCLLTLCHLLPDLPILKKKKVDGRYHDIPYVEALSPAPRSHSPPYTRTEEARREELNTLVSRSGEKAVRYLLDAHTATEDTSLPEHIRAPQDGYGLPGGAVASPAPAEGGFGELDWQGTAGDHRSLPLEAHHHHHGYAPPVSLRHQPPAQPPVDYAFERRKDMLRAQLFDHDLTNLQLRASLSLMEDAGEGGAQGALPASQQAMLGKRSEDGTPSLRSYISRRSQEDDPEAQRRRHLMLQEEERKRQEKERERQEVEAMLEQLDSRMVETVHRQSVKQEEVHRRILARQHRNDYKLSALRQEYQRTMERQQDIERITKEKHRREREAFLRQMASARESLAEGGGGGGGGGVASPATPKKSQVRPSADLEEARQRKDRIILGPAVHDEFLRWLRSGGLREGGGGWAEADSEALVKRLGGVAAKMRQNGERADLITRVGAVQGTVKRELDMVRSRKGAEVRSTSRVRPDVTKPQPFKLMKPSRVRYRQLTDSQFRDELKDRELSFTETQQRMRQEHLDSHRSKSADAGGRR